MTARPVHTGENGRVATTKREDLAEFLRARRQALDPEQVGLPAGTRRRTVGLRREEVALLAGVSVSWYTWLEQGRPINPSDSVLDALARGLRLSPTERDHLHALAARGRPAAPDEQVAEPPDALVRLVTSFEPAPAYVLGPRWDYLAWNRAQARLFPAIDRLAPADRNLVWVVFARADTRTLIVEWESEARRILSEFRADTTNRRDDPHIRALVDRLLAASPEFADWWPRHDVAGFATRLRRYQHPYAGELVFEYQQLIPAEWPGLRVVCQLSIPGDDSAARLAAWHRVV